MFEISKYKKSNVKISIRLPENMNDTLKREFDSFKSKKSLWWYNIINLFHIFE